jgi:hypothetical protein
MSTEKQKEQVPKLNAQSSIMYNNGQLEQPWDKMVTCVHFFFLQQVTCVPWKPLTNDSMGHVVHILSSKTMLQYTIRSSGQQKCARAHDELSCFHIVYSKRRLTSK